MADLDKDKQHDGDANRDPITGAPGSHPVGTGLGAAGGGAVGAGIGAVGGPVGAVVGAAIGAVAGGLAGKGVAEMVDPTVEDAYWRENYNREPYYEQGRSYEDYDPAYRTGYQGFATHYKPGTRYEDVEPHLQTDYNKNRSSSNLEWEKARSATRAAWHRAERRLPGDADKDGR